MTHTQLALLGVAAVVLGLVAAGLAVYAVVLARTTVQAVRILTSPRGEPPAPRNLARERRETDQGPPAGVEERRRHRAPDDARARRRDVDDPRWRIPGADERVQTMPQRAVRPPMPEDAHPETRDMRALPPPGTSIR
jgi:hypothetical protein